MAENDLTQHALSHGKGDFKVVVLGGGRDANGNLPCAAVFGEPKNWCLVRIHSRCVYGEIFEAVDCDCRSQLQRSMEMMRKRSGVLIYLDQEGRGAGLLTKARGYLLSQTEGLDTYSSYRNLGVPEDSRRYDDAVAILRKLRLPRVTLLTNNPTKVQALKNAGFGVRQRSLLVPGQSAQAIEYLRAKADFGHKISKSKLTVEPAAEQSSEAPQSSRARRLYPKFVSRLTESSGNERATAAKARGRRSRSV